jgi:hypothetical protein
MGPCRVRAHRRRQVGRRRRRPAGRCTTPTRPPARRLRDRSNPARGRPPVGRQVTGGRGAQGRTGRRGAAVPGSGAPRGAARRCTGPARRGTADSSVVVAPPRRGRTRRDHGTGGGDVGRAVPPPVSVNRRVARVPVAPVPRARPRARDTLGGPAATRRAGTASSPRRTRWIRCATRSSPRERGMRWTAARRWRPGSAPSRRSRCGAVGRTGGRRAVGGRLGGAADGDA